MHRESFRKLDSRCGRFVVRHADMSDSNVVIRKKRGRPRIGQTPVVSFRLDLEWQRDVDQWRSGEPDLASRSDAIRCLIGMGLSAAYAERKQAGRKEG
jgi:hypothetical protein